MLSNKCLLRSCRSCQSLSIEKDVQENQHHNHLIRFLCAKKRAPKKSFIKTSRYFFLHNEQETREGRKAEQQKYSDTTYLFYRDEHIST
ncbi:MAG: hypothetical protein ACI8RD_014735 [Bacillariaceae sp.]|jgi:hypothetical protein